MTLDEAILHAREVAEIQRNNDKLNKTLGVISPYYKTDCIKSAEEHEQLAEWLEDYKHIKQWKSDVIDSFCKYDASSLEELVTNVRNKAIDDFANGISECLGVENATKYGNKNAEQQRMSYDTLMKYEIADAIEDIAEQLKAGDTDAESI